MKVVLFEVEPASSERPAASVRIPGVGVPGVAGVPGVTVPPVDNTDATVPVPPSVAPVPTVTALAVCVPSTKSVPAVTDVSPV